MTSPMCRCHKKLSEADGGKLMQSFEQFLIQYGVDDTDGFIHFLENLSEDTEQTPPPEIENQVNRVFKIFFNH